MFMSNGTRRCLQTLGRIQWMRNDVDASRRTLKDACEQLGRNSQVLNVWARLELSRRNVSRARQLVKKALEWNPDDIYALQIWAQLEDMAGRIERSKELYGRARNAAPDNAAVIHGSAIHLRKQHEDAAADRNLTKLRQLDPNNGYLCHTCGQKARQEGDVASARMYFERGTQAAGESNKAVIRADKMAAL